MVPSESQSGRSHLMSIFKQRSSLYALSYFMLGAMDTAQKSNKIISSSTFKPPPRVTLTEQKKEAWLRDLANPAVPLRKLSRTIPHGTRNRSLLEQCCNKSIPISRAIWFAKCVGANELRGLKRKGTNQSGAVTESQWITEWTDQVTEFIEKTIREYPKDSSYNNSVSAKASPTTPAPLASSSSASVKNSLLTGHSISNASSPLASGMTKIPLLPTKPGSNSFNPSTPMTKSLSNTVSLLWKDRMDYIIKLAVNLFSEGLLDKKFFLRWCVNNFQICALDELPAALLFIRLFWEGIVQSRSLSQALVLALLERYSALSSAELSRHTVMSTFKDNVSECLTNFFLLSPDSFVIPSQWDKIRLALSEALKSNENEVIGQIFEVVSSRNESLTMADSPSIRASRDPQFLIIDALDKAKPPYSWSVLEQTITSSKVTESDTLFSAFQWATTSTRKGVDRVYICGNLLTALHSDFKWNISEQFIEFLDSITSADDYNMNNVYDLILEFLDRDWFYAGTFFRRLISQGVLYTNTSLPLAKVKIALLQNLPVLYSPSMRNQQRLLLNGLKNQEVSLERNAAILNHIKGELTTIFSFLWANSQSKPTALYELSDVQVKYLRELSKSSQMEICGWIFKATEDRLSLTDFELTIQQFAALQNIFELLRDYKALYCLIESLVIKASNENLLYFMANTLKDHMHIFCAIADVVHLIQLFATQYLSFKQRPKLSKGLYDIFMFALVDIPDLKPQWKMDLEQIIHPVGQSSLKDITTLSPMSDIVNESNLNTNQEQNEQVYENYVRDSSDPQRLQKHVVDSLKRLSDASNTADNALPYFTLREVSTILQHLKDVDPASFTEITSKWLLENMESEFGEQYLGLARFFIYLVVYECTALDKIVELFVNKVDTNAHEAKMLLSLISEEYVGNLQLLASERATLEIQRRYFENNFPSLYLRCLSFVIIENAKVSSNSSFSNETLSFLISTTSTDIQSVVSEFLDPISESGIGHAVDEVRLLLSQLLRLNHDVFRSLKDEILLVVENRNTMSIALSQAYMRVILLDEKKKAILESNDNITISSLMDVINTAETKNLCHRGLGDVMVYIPDDLKAGLLAQCEISFLQSPHFPIVANMNTGEGNITDYLLEVVDAISGVPTPVPIFASKSLILLERFATIHEKCEKYVDSGNEKQENNDTGKLYSSDAPDVEMTDVTQEGSESEVLRSALLLFIKIILIHSSKQNEQHDLHHALREKLTMGIFKLISTPFISLNPDLHRLLMDLADSIKSEIAVTSDSNSVHTVNSPDSRAGSVSASSNIAGTADTSASFSASILSTISPSLFAKSNVDPAKINGKNFVNESSPLDDLALYNRTSKNFSELNIRAFDLLEESNHTMAINDVALNLALFDAVIEKKNPA